jgi:hypothetical protein
MVRVLVPGGYLITTRRRGRDASFIPGKTYTLSVLSELLSSLGLTGIRIESWQLDYDLVWGHRVGDGSTDIPELMKVILCPQCRQARLSQRNQFLFCGYCGRVIHEAEGILDMG